MFRYIESEKKTKIELIGKYKVLARLHKLQNYNSNNKEVEANSVVREFCLLYPEFKNITLQEVYSIPVDNGVTLEVREYNFTEYERPGFPHYEELLALNELVGKYIGYNVFRTMVGEKYYCKEWFMKGSFEVIYIQERFKSEQLFILQCIKEPSIRVDGFVDEWNYGVLSRTGKFYKSKNLLSSVLLKESDEKHLSLIERTERFKNEEK